MISVEVTLSRTMSLDLHEVNALRRSLVELAQVPSQGDPAAIFDALRSCVPVAAGLVGIATPATMGAMSNRPVRLPEAVLSSWMATQREYVVDAFARLFFSANEGDFWRDKDSIRGRLRKGFQVLDTLDAHGLGEGAGYKVLQREVPGRGTEHAMLALLTERGTRFSDRDGGLLKVLGPAVRDAVLRAGVPLIPSRSILGQIIEEQALGYICLSLRGSVMEANQRAHELVSRYHKIARIPPGRRVFGDFIAVAKDRTRGGRTLHLPHMDRTTLEVRAHALAKEAHSLSEDVTLLVLREWQLPTPTGRAAVPDVLRQLTPRRRQIALMLANTAGSYKELAAALEIKEPTMRTHVEHIYRALDVHSRAELGLLLR